VLSAACVDAKGTPENQAAQAAAASTRGVEESVIVGLPQ
jgi:hypothetical protein